MYHSAMALYPDARRDEFLLPLKKLNLKPGDLLIDLPSGGGYLHRYLPANVQVHCLESSQAFADYCQQQKLKVSLYHQHHLPLSDQYADALISIAGLHHIRDKQPLFQSIFRVLKPSGQLCITDVEQGSAVAGFLDDIVDRYSQTGHRGRFLNTVTAEQLSEVGFQGIQWERLNYPWYFADEASVLNYFQLLFGLEKASLEQVGQGIDQYLNRQITPSGIQVNWQLLCLTAHRLA